MRPGWCALLYFAALAPAGFAQTVDKARIRQAIEMPAISTSFGVNFKAWERDGRGNKFDPVEKLGDLQKKLTGGADDAQNYLDQSAVYLECLKDKKKADEMVAKAEGALRPHMQTSDPKQAHLLTLYGSVLEALSENPWNDCEKWAKRAVNIGPQDWRTWAYLAHVRNQQIPIILCGGDDKNLPKERRTQEIIGMLCLQRLKAEHVDEAEKAINEAVQYHDKARELAPTDAKRQELRYGFRLTEVLLRNAICVYRNQKAPFPQMQLERCMLDELQNCARLHHDHLLWQSQLVHQLVIVGWRTKHNNDKPSKTFQPARPEDMTAIREAMGRIEKLAAESKGETATFCYAMLGALSASMQDNVSVEKYARHILQIEATHQMASEQLQQALLLQNRFADQLEVAQRLAQAHHTSRNDYLQAKALVLNNRFDLAEQSCVAGIKKNADDVHCLLGMAALVLRKGDDAQSLQFAAELLERAQRGCRPEMGPSVLTEHEYLASIHQALSGETSLARLRLERLRSDNPDNPRYDKVLSVLPN